MSFEYRQVQSSSILQIGYDVATRTLEVTFQSMRTYRFDNVPKALADEFLNVKSKGTYFAEFIRDKFTYRCMNPPLRKEKPSEEKTKKQFTPKEAKKILGI